MKLEAKNLVHFYGQKKVLNNVNLNVSSGEIVGLLGPNGAGKTTSFRILAGLIHPKQGGVYLDEKEITRWPIYRRARSGLGYLTQESSVFRALTVLQNLLIVFSSKGLNSQEAKTRAQRLLEEFGLADLRDQAAFTLSGGERRRLEIARSLTADPKILMLDEPFTGIDPVTVDELKLLLVQLKAKGIGIVITDHNARETLKVIDRSYLIYEGKILIHGSAQDLLRDEHARRLYLGWEISL